MTAIDPTEAQIEAAVFRRLLEHLAHRTDVQNIDLMVHSGFCRNCLSDWYQEAAEKQDTPVDKDAARERVYGMPYGEFKDKYQGPASEEQLARMKESIAKNQLPDG